MFMSGLRSAPMGACPDIDTRRQIQGKVCYGCEILALFIC